MNESIDLEIDELENFISKFTNLKIERLFVLNSCKNYMGHLQTGGIPILIIVCEADGFDEFLFFIFKPDNKILVIDHNEYYEYFGKYLKSIFDLEGLEYIDEMFFFCDCLANFEDYEFENEDKNILVCDNISLLQRKYLEDDIQYRGLCIIEFKEKITFLRDDSGILKINIDLNDYPLKNCREEIYEDFYASALYGDDNYETSIGMIVL